MKITSIHQEVCTKCNLCSYECPLRLFRIEDDSLKFHDPMGSCIECGHCVAVCPSNAIKYDFIKQEDSAFYEADEFEKINTENLPKTIGNIISKRRSIRKYKNKEVSQEDIELIMEAMGRSPSASNKMHRKYYIYQQQTLLNKLEDEVAKYFAGFLRKLMNPILLFFQASSIKNKSMTFKEKYRNVSSSNKGFYNSIIDKRYRFFFNAPAVIVITAPEQYSKHHKSFLRPDAHTAVTHGVLMAESLGLGTCWIGFAELALNKNCKAKKSLGIPEKEEVLAAFTIGHPAIQYKRMAPRGPVPVKWYK